MKLFCRCHRHRAVLVWQCSAMLRIMQCERCNRLWLFNAVTMQATRITQEEAENLQREFDGQKPPAE
jgi:hypothetical protein